MKVAACTMMKYKKVKYLPECLACLLLLLPNLVALFLAEDLGGILPRIYYAFISVCCFLVPALLLKARTFFLVQSPLLLLGCIELAHLIINKTTTSLLFVYTCMIAEKGEFLELLSTGWLLALLILCVWGLYIYIIIRYVDNRYLWTTKTRSYIGIFIGISFLLIGLTYVDLPDKSKWRIFPIHNETIGNELLSYTEKVFPLNLYLCTGRIIHLRKDIKQEETHVNDFSFGATYNSSEEETTVVLIIGETARYSNFGINGYTRPTTPHLSQRSHLISFDSVYSIANLTTVSVPFMLSRATPMHPEIYTHEKSIVDAFSEAGYYTAWVANQSFGNPFLMRISENCDYQHYIPTDVKNHDNLDIRLLDYAQNIMENDSKQKLIVLHSLGCHFKYNLRYPDSFRYYQPDLSSETPLKDILNPDDNPDIHLKELLEKTDLLEGMRELLVNSYDNAICYTDYFIDSTISMLDAQNKPAVLIYIGDHGENLLDDERHLFLHATYQGSVYEYHVPLFVWTSDEYRTLHPNVENNLQANKSKSITSMVLFHSLMEAGNISYPLWDASMSIFNPQLRSDSVLYGLDANLKLKQLPK